MRHIAGADAYKAAHDALITLRGPANAQALENLAADLGLEAAPILEMMSDPAITEELQANRALAEKLAINGTPTFVLGDDMLRGYVPLDGMQQMVAALRAE